MSYPHLPIASNAARLGARRVVHDAATGQLWCVTEVDTRGIPGARAAACLLFDSPMAVRRVWHYPAGWARLGDAELLALSWTV